MTRPSDASIARAYDKACAEIERLQKEDPSTCIALHGALVLIEKFARDFDAEAKDVAGEMGAVDPVVRYNDDGSLDEVIGTGAFHLEQMDHNHWWMRLGPHSVWLHAKGKIKASIGLNEQRGASAPTAVEGEG